jgi:hypothetical protein
MLTPATDGYAACHWETSGWTNVLPAPTSWPAVALLWPAVAVTATQAASNAVPATTDAVRLVTLKII